MSYPSRHSQRGFTLIEILVTLVLISVGLLGVAALQLTTLRGNQESYVRSQASVLVADILDRMRANPVAFRAGRYDADFDSVTSTDVRASADLAEWQGLIDRSLPGTDGQASGRIVRTQAGNRFVVTITVRWNERSEGSGRDINLAGARQFQARTEI